MAAPDILRRSRIAPLVSGKIRESMGTPESTSERRGVLWMLLSIVFFSANVLLLRGVSLHAPAADGWVASAYRDDVRVPAAFSGAGFLDPDVDAGGDGAGGDAVFRGTIESAGSRRRRGDAGGDLAGGAAGVGSERGRCEGVNAKRIRRPCDSHRILPPFSPLLFVGSLGTPAFPLRAPCSADRPLRRIHPLHWMV